MTHLARGFAFGLTHGAITHDMDCDGGGGVSHHLLRAGMPLKAARRTLNQNIFNGMRSRIPRCAQCRIREGRILSTGETIFYRPAPSGSSRDSDGSVTPPPLRP